MLQKYPNYHQNRFQHKPPKVFTKRTSSTIDEIALLMMLGYLKSGRSTSIDSQLKNPVYSQCWKGYGEQSIHSRNLLFLFSVLLEEGTVIKWL